MPEDSDGGQPEQPVTAKETVLTPPGAEPINALEWAARPNLPPMILVSGQSESMRWADFAGRMSGENRVLAIELEPDNGLRLLQAVWAVGEAAMVIAQGPAPGAAAVHVASIAPGALRGLVLVDCQLEHGRAEHRELAVPVLIFRGRQSLTTSHVDAVTLRGEIARSRLIEPEECTDWPADGCAVQLEAAVRLYLQDLDTTPLDYTADG